MKTISLQDINTVCDQAGKELAAPTVIADNGAGFALAFDIDGERYEVIDGNGDRLSFRTIEHLLDVLIDTPELAQVAQLDFSHWLPTPRYG
jgi:hypothetical protein